MRVIVLQDHSGVEDKDRPIGYEAKKGQIVSLNPHQAKNWMIPEGIVALDTPENRIRYRDIIEAFQKELAEEKEKLRAAKLLNQKN